MSFMNAFLGYNKILLDQGDQEKTTFITKGVVLLLGHALRPEERGSNIQRLVNKILGNI